MGIRMDDDDDEPGCGAFSEDILKIEIYGPDVRVSVRVCRLHVC